MTSKSMDDHALETEKIHSYDETKNASIAYFNGDELAAEVFAGKYALRNEKNELLELTPSDMHTRLAREFSRIESNYPNPMSESEIYELLSSWKVVPQGSPMSAIGNKNQYQSLSNCFVIEGCHDSYSSIVQNDELQCNIMKRRGGVGHDISNIRPRGVKTNNAARTSDGIGIFMERFSNATREVAQNGRRGALMLTISVAHPDIETFVTIKRDLTKVTGANISIRVSDEFMNAVKSSSEFTLRWPVNSSIEDAVVKRPINARELWDKIIESAHLSAEPGVLFWDTVHKNGTADIYDEFKSVSTNPCGEIPLSRADSCRLLVINTTKYVADEFTNNAVFDFHSFERDTRKAQRLMDDLVDLEIEAIDRIIKKIDSDLEPPRTKRNEIELWQEIKDVAMKGRRTGLGITGLGDVMAMCNVTYGSDESIKLTERIYRSLAVAAHAESVAMASERGPFLACKPELYANGHPFFDRLKEHSEESTWNSFLKIGRRNIALTTTAPAGSVSILTQTTSGIEPAFMVSYKRRKKINLNDDDSRIDFIDDSGDKWQEYTIYHHGFKRWMDVTKNDNVELSPYWMATSNDVDWRASVQLQATAQRYVEHSISKTINLPSTATRELISELYLNAWESGCKGVTIYRDGSRTGVLISDKQDTQANQPNMMSETHAPRRPKELPCDIHRATVKGDVYLVLVGLYDDRPYEIFCGLQQHVEVPKKIKKGTLVKNGKIGGIATYNLVIPIDDDHLVFKNVVELFDNPTNGAFSRTISLALRHGVPIQYLSEQLKKDKHSDITSFSSVIARVLSKHYIPDGTRVTTEKSCSSCGSTNLAYQQGCVTCMQCGNSKCG